MLVQAWAGDSGTAALATAGDTGAPQGQGHQGRRFLTTGEICSVPKAMCKWVAEQLLTVSVTGQGGDPLLLMPLFSFPRSPPGQHWGQVDPQFLVDPVSSPASCLPPPWPWRTLLLLRSLRHSTNLPRGEPGMGHVPNSTAPASPHQAGAGNRGFNNSKWGEGMVKFVTAAGVGPGEQLCNCHWGQKLSGHFCSNNSSREGTGTRHSPKPVPTSSTSGCSSPQDSDHTQRISLILLTRVVWGAAEGTEGAQLLVLFFFFLSLWGTFCPQALSRVSLTGTFTAHLQDQQHPQREFSPHAQNHTGHLINGFSLLLFASLCSAYIQIPSPTLSLCTPCPWGAISGQEKYRRYQCKEPSPPASL